MQLNQYGFEPITLDCGRIARYGFADWDAFLAAMSSQDFVPLSKELDMMAQAWSKNPATAVSESERVSSEVRERWLEIDSTMFGNVYDRCSSYAATFQTP